ncbi:hypothetical protein HaLaN_01462, partial [Haematococcus lacustris]
MMRAKHTTGACSCSLLLTSAAGQHHRPRPFVETWDVGCMYVLKRYHQIDGSVALLTLGVMHLNLCWWPQCGQRDRNRLPDGAPDVECVTTMQVNLQVGQAAGQSAMKGKKRKGTDEPKQSKPKQAQSQSSYTPVSEMSTTGTHGRDSYHLHLHLHDYMQFCAAHRLIHDCI